MTTTAPTILPPGLLAHLRQLVPKRALTYNESLVMAQQQAVRLRELLMIKTPALPLDWVPGLPKLTVEVVPAHALEDDTSGLTTRQDGRYLIAVNKNRSRNHRRFTLCHELKHVVDYPYARLWHAGLGYGDAGRKAYQVERVADHFAAHALMPTSLVKRAWGYGVQDLRALSQLFEVSEAAMHIRLRNLGLTDTGDLPPAAYFRRPSRAFDPLTLIA